jgi:hypothetical protein
MAKYTFFHLRRNFLFLNLKHILNFELGQYFCFDVVNDAIKMKQFIIFYLF